MNSTLISQFPSLKRLVNNKAVSYLDGPAGTQVPAYVIDSISSYYQRSNANTHGVFATTIETDELMHQARETCATFLNAPSYACISFGQNMTTLNYSLSRAIGRHLKKGDEIIITQLDHESNRGPWLALASLGITIKEVHLKEDGTLNYEQFESLLNEKTKLICMGMASNYTGTINDYLLARQFADQVGAWLMLDAVHYAPHFSLDVQEINCDFLICSAYKFYGPHVGIFYAKPGLLDQLDTDNLRTNKQTAPYKLETGTLNHAAIAGVKAAIEFIASQGDGNQLRHKLDSAYVKISAHENQLALRLFNYLNDTSQYNIVGPDFQNQRAPTISFYSEKVGAIEICQKLAQENIFAWGGHFYAIRASEIMGREDKGGVVRMGMSIYTMQHDVDNTIGALSSI